MTIQPGRCLTAGRYGVADLAIGDWLTTARLTVTADHIDRFATLSGDHFEIHMSREAAQRFGFADRVAHGLLVLALVDGLKNNTPAQFNVIAALGWDVRFTAPVLLGDTIQARLDVERLRPLSAGTRGVLDLRQIVTNQRNETVQDGVNRLMISA